MKATLLDGLTLAPLERRTPGAALPSAAYRAVGRATVVYGSAVGECSTDMRTLARLIRVMRNQDFMARPEEV